MRQTTKSKPNYQHTIEKSVAFIAVQSENKIHCKSHFVELLWSKKYDFFKFKNLCQG